MAFDFPNSPTLGQTSNGYIWDGEKWTSSAATGSIYISDTPPSAAPVGSLWYESDTGMLFFRYNDGTSSQWVLAVPGVSAAALSAVTYVPQTLTAPQKAQATTNIGAVAKAGDTMTGPIGATSFNLTINGGSAYNVPDRSSNAANNWSIYADSNSLRFYTAAGDLMTLASVSGDLAWTGAAWTAYTPGVTVGGGAGTATGRYKRLGKTCAVAFAVSVTTAGTLTGVSLPVQAGGANCVLNGRENALTGNQWHGLINPSATGVIMFSYNNQNAVGVGGSVIMSGIYETV